MKILAQTYWGNPLQAYLLVLLAILLLWFIRLIVKRYLLSRLLQAVKNTDQIYDDLLVTALDRFVFPLVYSILNIQIVRQLELSTTWITILDTAQLLVIVYFSIKFINFFIFESLHLSMTRKGEDANRLRQLNGMLFIVKSIIWIIGILFVLENKGYDVKTFIAGLGVGGIAIALAAQNILGDIFNYFVIFFDKPFEIGDFVIFEGNMGTIKNIGIKTTRIDSLSGQELVVSNSILGGKVISNYKRMPKRRVVFQIGVEYSTPSGQIKKIPEMLAQIVQQDTELKFDRAHILQFGAYSIDFEVVYYVSGSDYNVYMDKHQRICFDILDRFEEENIAFALPTQHLFMRDSKLDITMDDQLEWSGTNRLKRD